LQIALFPLNTVLFPGGVLPLRIFETRYMDMARDCLRDDKAFGVCLITKGTEVGGGAATERIGTLATIAGWDMEQLGVLNVRCLGGRRFEILSRTTQADGLQTAQVRLIDADAESRLAAEHRPCADLLRRVIDDLAASASASAQAEEGKAEAATMRTAFEPPYQLDSAVWVGNRLCEILPVPLKAKQKLMELDDGYTRLDIVLQYLRQHAVLK
jgi:hypothetical protein